MHTYTSSASTHTLMLESTSILSISAFKKRQVSQHTLTQQREYMTKGVLHQCVPICGCVCLREETGDGQCVFACVCVSERDGQIYVCACE